MTNQVSLKAAQALQTIGADFVGGVCFLKHVEIGRWLNGEFYVDPGHEELIEAAKSEAVANAASKAEAKAAEAAVNTVKTATTPDGTSQNEAEEVLKALGVESAKG